VLHRHTILFSGDAQQAARQLYSQKAVFVSSDVVANPTAQLGFHKAFLVRDPDGHALEIEEP
jgi:hypothetical protein